MKNNTNTGPASANLTPTENLPPELVATLDVIGGKWKLPILWRLTQGEMRFSELRRALPRVTQHMLTAHLRELETDGLISRTAYAEVPPRVVYAITDHGRSLDRVLLALYVWGAGHIKRSYELTQKVDKPRRSLSPRRPSPVAGEHDAWMVDIRQLALSDDVRKDRPSVRGKDGNAVSRVELQTRHDPCARAAAAGVRRRRDRPVAVLR